MFKESVKINYKICFREVFGWVHVILKMGRKVVIDLYPFFERILPMIRYYLKTDVSPLREEEKKNTDLFIWIHSEWILLHLFTCPFFVGCNISCYYHCPCITSLNNAHTNIVDQFPTPLPN